MNWIEKWLTPFRMGTTSSTTMQSLGRSNNARRLQVRKKVFVCLFVFYRQDCHEAENCRC